MIYKEYFDLTVDYQKQYGEDTSLVLMQVGSFYEMYGLRTEEEGSDSPFSNMQKAAIACCLKIADKKDRFDWKGVSYGVMMAGFGECSLDKYLPLLVDAGFSVAVYIQEDDMVKRCKKRVFYGVFSAGTILGGDVTTTVSNHVMVLWVHPYVPLGKKTHHYVCAWACTDNATGVSYLYQYMVEEPHPGMVTPACFDELERAVSTYSPSELVLVVGGDVLYEKRDLVLQFVGASGCKRVHVFSEADEKPAKCAKPAYVQALLQQQFGDERCQQVCLELQQNEYATMAYCFLLDFLRQHSPHWVERVQMPHLASVGGRVVLGNHTLKQLNVLSSSSSSSSDACLLTMLNKTMTPMGHQAFVHALLHPTTERALLEREYDAMDTLLQDTVLPLVRKCLTEVRHMERIVRHMVHGKGSVQQVGHLVQGCRALVKLFVEVPLLSQCYEAGWENEGVRQAVAFEEGLSRWVDVEACVSGSKSDVILPGVDAGLDGLEMQEGVVREDLESLQRQLNECLGSAHVKWHETAKSGSSLQITAVRGKALQRVLLGGENNDACFLLPSGARIPYAELRVQTGTGADTIHSGSVSTLFRRLALLEEQVETRRNQVWKTAVLARIVEEWMTPLQKVSEVLKRVDVLQCKVWLASEYCYCRPELVMEDESFMKVEALRHPLVERLQTQEIYVANDVTLGTSEDTKQGILLYGTNAVGKTSFIKSVGLAVLMAQAGMFVAASSFQFRPYRAIYSRILGNDDLFRGMSTFVVEMSELRTLLVEAGPDVLVLGDEVCSGTETESALSIMMATLRLLVTRGSHFLFATHFHELSRWSEMRELSRNVAMKHMEVLYDAAKDRLVYDRRLKEGPGPAIYGLEVAKSLYMPAEMLEDAFRLRERYFPHVRTLLSMEPTRYNRGKIRQPLCEACGEGVGEEVHHLVPQKEANVQGTLWSPLSRTPFHKNHAANLQTLCSRCHDAIHSVESN